MNGIKVTKDRPGMFQVEHKASKMRGDPSITFTFVETVGSLKGLIASLNDKVERFEASSEANAELAARYEAQLREQTEKTKHMVEKHLRKHSKKSALRWHAAPGRGAFNGGRGGDGSDLLDR